MKNINKGFASVYIFVIIGILILIGVVYFFTLGKSSNREESYFSGKVSDMFKKSEPLECSTEVNNAEGSMKAVYYFDNQNKKVRVDMQSVDKSTGATVNTVSITKDGWNYFWDNLMNKDGMKVKLDENKIETTEAEIKKVDVSVDMNKEFDFTCKPWEVDSTKFDLPKDKSFKDLSSLSNNLPNLQNSNISPGTDFCSMCNMIPQGDEKNECLKSCKQSN